MSKQRLQFFIAAGLLVALVAGFFLAKGPFFKWRARRLEATARALLGQGREQEASLAARAALQMDGQNTDACSVMGQIAARQHSPAAIAWLQKAAELRPGNPTALLDLAFTATGLGEMYVAENALRSVPERERDTARYHQTMAAWLIALSQSQNAEPQLQRALVLDPQNIHLKLSLAAVHLALASPEKADGPRAELEALRQLPEAELEATRDLLADARRRNDSTRALQLATELHKIRQATIADHLLYLEELQRAHRPEFETEFAGLRNSAAHAGDVYTVMEWMNAHDLAAQIAPWYDTLPDSLRRQFPVPLAMAEACVAIGDWKRLRDLIHDADWGDLDFVRQAFDLRSFDETSGHSRGPAFAGRWERAMVSTRGNPNAIAMLARLVHGWGWKAEASQLWWLLANRSSGQQQALASLFEEQLADKNAKELYCISRRILQIEPANPVAKNNVAMFALLLGEDLGEAGKLAEENLCVAPTDPGLLSTYAFSLYRQNRLPEARAAMEKIPVAALNEPSLAACYGVILAAVGEREKAQPFLDLAMRGKDRLFPEEIALVEQARQPPPP